VNGAEYRAGKSNRRWKLMVFGLWLRHPVWTWKMYRDTPSMVFVPGHTFGDGDG
jgi:hypothetical protein